MAQVKNESNEKSYLESDVFVDFCDSVTIHDRVLLVEGKKFYVSSAILTFASEFFRGLFNSYFKENNQQEISLEDVKAEEFECFLRALYPLNYKATVTNIAGLVKLSCRFLAPSVWQKCMDFLRDEDNFAMLNKHDLLLWSEDSGSKELKAKIEKYWVREFSSLSEDEKGEVMDSAFTHELDNLKKYIENLLVQEFELLNIPSNMGLWRYTLPRKYKVTSLTEAFKIFVRRTYGVFLNTGQISVFEKADAKSQLKQAYEKHVINELNKTKMLRDDAIVMVLDIASKYNLANVLAAFSQYLISQFDSKPSFKLVELIIDYDLENFKNYVSKYLKRTGFDSLSKREKKEISEAKANVQKFVLESFVDNDE